MARYYSHLDFIEIEEETTCAICKRKCEKKEEMGKHVCECGCGANNMICMECPIGSIFQPVRCKKTIAATRKEQDEERNKRTWNEMKKKQIKRKKHKKKHFFL